jgi:hypothetical protein
MILHKALERSTNKGDKVRVNVASKNINLIAFNTVMIEYPLCIG